MSNTLNLAKKLIKSVGNDIGSSVESGIEALKIAAEELRNAESALLIYRGLSASNVSFLELTLGEAKAKIKSMDLKLISKLELDYSQAYILVGGTVYSG
jgi:hypothetical protein